jgi:hypothetical protein
MPDVLFHRITSPNRRLQIFDTSLDMPFSQIPCAAVGAYYPSGKHFAVDCILVRRAKRALCKQPVAFVS